MKDTTPHRKALLAELARLEASRQSLTDIRAQLRGRAEQQHDSLHSVLRGTEQAVDADRAGGVLGLRRLKRLHAERERLKRVLDEGQPDDG